jgi:hypothetical protein|tara:strand:+ start:1343 stop:1753 length:411 start_codon:yes stop_codon:yes gene_type:complete
MTKVRKDRNPRYTKALDLAEVNNDLMKANSSHNYSMRMRVIGLDKKVTSLVEELQPRNGKLTDAYLKLSHRYWSMLTALEARNSRIELLEKELKDYVPDHWIFADEDSNEDEDNISDEPDPDQLEFDFDTDHLKPN